MPDSIFDDLLPSAKKPGPFDDLLPERPPPLVTTRTDEQGYAQAPAGFKSGLRQPVPSDAPYVPVPDVRAVPDPYRPTPVLKSGLRAPVSPPIDVRKLPPTPTIFDDLVPAAAEPAEKPKAPRDAAMDFYRGFGRGVKDVYRGELGISRELFSKLLGSMDNPEDREGLIGNLRTLNYALLRTLSVPADIAYRSIPAIIEGTIQGIEGAAGQERGSMGELRNLAQFLMAESGQGDWVPLQAIREHARATDRKTLVNELTEGERAVFPQTEKEMIDQGFATREGDALVLTPRGLAQAAAPPELKPGGAVPAAVEAKQEVPITGATEPGVPVAAAPPVREEPQAPATAPPAETPAPAAPQAPETGVIPGTAGTPLLPGETRTATGDIQRPPTTPAEPPVSAPTEAVSRPPTEPVVPRGTEPVEGLPETLYRGYGREDQRAAYNSLAGNIPIMGEGRYYALSEDEAKEFGPNVETLKPEFKNPLVIRSGQEWTALTKEAGWEFPNPFGRDPTVLRADIDRLNALVREKGHDAVAILWDDAVQGDRDANGRDLKLLRNVFDRPQVFVPGAEKPVTEARAAGVTRSPEAAEPKIASVVTPSGRRVDVEPELVDLSKLVVSHTDDLNVNPDYPAALQPRARERAASGTQIAEIAGRLDPALLGESPTADVGAPIVGRDNVVESGNGRILALRRAYQERLSGAERYRAWLEQQGYDTTGMEMPVLIRRRTTELSPEDRIAFAREANQRTTLGMSDVEQATADARMLSDTMLDLYKGGDLTLAGNRDLVRAFAEQLPATERAELVTAEGTLSQTGLRRLQNAMFAKAWGEPGLLTALRESQDTNVRAIGGAMMDAAPAWAAMRSRLSATGRTELDATQPIIDAINIVRKARDNGQPIRMMVFQDDMFGGRADPALENALDIFFRPDPKTGEPTYTRQRSRVDMHEGLRRIAAEAEKTEAGPGLFNDIPAVTVNELLALGSREGGKDLLGDVQGMRLEPPPLRETIAEKAARMEDLHSENFGPKPILGSGTAFERLYEQQRARLVAEQAERDRIAAIEDAAAAEEAAERYRSEAARISESDRLAVEEAARRGEPTQPARGPGVGAGPGARYTGLRRDAANAATPRVKDVMRREHIIRELSKALKLRIYYGKVKGRNMLGFYRKRIEEVRIKRMNDMEVVGHEIAHALDDRYPEIRSQWAPRTAAKKPIRDELAGVSYDKSKLDEGFAEFTRLWLTQKDEAATRAPLLNQWFEDWLNRNPQIGQPLRKTQTDMHAWFDQNALDRQASKIGMERLLADKLELNGDNARQTMLDDMHGIYRMEYELTGKVNPGGVYETARLTKGSRAIVEGALRFGVPKVLPNGRTGFVGKGLEQILSPIVRDLDDWILYAVAKSANELKGQGRENLYTQVEIDEGLRLATPEFEQAFNEYQEWNKGIVDFAVEKGLIDPEKRKLWNREFYLPFYREIDAHGVQAGKGHGAMPGQFTGIRALTGGTGNLRDILGNIVQNAAMLIEGAVENEARLAVFDLASKDRGGYFMTRIGKESVPALVDAEQIAKTVATALGVPARDPLIRQLESQLDPLVTFFQHGMAPKGRNIVTALRDGKPIYAEVGDPYLYRALLAMRPEGRGVTWRVVNSLRRLMQGAITFHPNFLVAHLSRDAIQGYVLSENGFKPMFDSARGVFSRLVEDQNYKDFVANGGGLFGAHLDGHGWRRYLETYYSSKGIDYRTVLNTPRKVLYFLEKAADAAGSGTRIGEFNRAIKKGVDAKHAAFRAREIATDFAVHGDYKGGGPILGVAGTITKGMAALLPFFNASLVSSDRIIRSLYRSEEVRAKVAMRLGLLTAASASLYMINRSIPEYRDLPEWDKDMHSHFFIPVPQAMEDSGIPGIIHSKNGTTYLHSRLPKAWEIGLHMTIAERAMEAMLGDARLKDVPGHLTNAFFSFEHFNPMEGPWKPFVEMMFNYNTMTHRPLVPEYLRQGDPGLWTRPGLHPSLEKFGEREIVLGIPRSLQIAPTSLDAVIHAYMGNWAESGLSMADKFASPISPPSSRWDEIPVVRRFFEDAPGKTTKHVEQFYDALDASLAATTTLRNLAKHGKIDLANQYAKGHDKELRSYVLLEETQKGISKINKFREAVLKAPKLTDVQGMAPAITAQLGADYRPLQNLKGKAAWNDVHKLKRLLIDGLFELRNRVAANSVKIVEPPPVPRIPLKSPLEMFGLTPQK